MPRKQTHNVAYLRLLQAHLTSRPCRPGVLGWRTVGLFTRTLYKSGMCSHASVSHNCSLHIRATEMVQTRMKVPNHQNDTAWIDQIRHLSGTGRIYTPPPPDMRSISLDVSMETPGGSGLSAVKR
jgi:hypothetical protein